jgi:hypothetical protein
MTPSSSRQAGPPGAYVNFLRDVNSFGEPGRRLEWEATAAGEYVNFLDFTIILCRGQIETRTFQKEINLYHYHPPASAQPPSILYGLIYGTMHRLYWQNTRSKWFTHFLNLFYPRLQARGHTDADLQSLFAKAAKRVERSEIPEPKTAQDNANALRDAVFLHAPFHPQNPPRKPSNWLSNTTTCNRCWNGTWTLLCDSSLSHTAGPQTSRIRCAEIASHRPPTLYYNITYNVPGSTTVITTLVGPSFGWTIVTENAYGVFSRSGHPAKRRIHNGWTPFANGHRSRTDTVCPPDPQSTTAYHTRLTTTPLHILVYFKNLK